MIVNWWQMIWWGGVVVENHVTHRLSPSFHSTLSKTLSSPIAPEEKNLWHCHWSRAPYTAQPQEIPNIGLHTEENSDTIGKMEGGSMFTMTDIGGRRWRVVHHYRWGLLVHVVSWFSFCLHCCCQLLHLNLPSGKGHHVLGCPPVLLEVHCRTGPCPPHQHAQWVRSVHWNSASHTANVHWWASTAAKHCHASCCWWGQLLPDGFAFLTRE